MKNIYRILSVLLIALLVFACEDRSDLTAPSAPATGNADFSSYVAIGNSLTAGYQNGSLYESGQEYSYPSLIAQQVKTSFVQPLVSEPGIPGKLEIASLTIVNGSIAGATPVANTGLGEPMNSTHTAPYNNLGIPGSVLADMFDNTNFAQKSLDRANPYFQLVLRDAQFGATVLDQAANLQPTFVTAWIGNNDVLGYATSGGTTGTDLATGTLPTENAVFDQLYSNLVNTLKATGANVAVANIPNVSVLPYFLTVGPTAAPGIKQLEDGGLAQGLVYETSAGVAVAPSSELATGQVLLTLLGSTHATKIGQPYGYFYRSTGVPAGIDTMQPFGLHPQNPWPNALILDKDEIAIVVNATTHYNSAIKSLSEANGFALVDIHSEFNNIFASGGKTYDGTLFTTRFISGGIFSLDGIHPTSQGAGIIANEFIKAINAKFSASIPEVNISSLPASIPLK